MFTTGISALSSTVLGEIKICMVCNEERMVAIMAVAVIDDTDKCCYCVTVPFTTARENYWLLFERLGCALVSTNIRPGSNPISVL